MCIRVKSYYTTIVAHTSGKGGGKLSFKEADLQEKYIEHLTDTSGVEVLLTVILPQLVSSMISDPILPLRVTKPAFSAALE